MAPYTIKWPNFLAQKLAIFFKQCWSAHLMDAVALGKSEDNFLEFKVLTVTEKL